MVFRLLILDRFADVYGERLRGDFPEISIEAAKSIDTIQTDLAEFDGLMAFGISISDELLGGMTGLKWIQSLATGTDHFTSSPAFRKQTILTSARGIHGAPMRETVALLMLSVARKMQRIMANQRARRWDRGDPWMLLEAKTAVLAGVGVSSSAVGTLLQAFGMRVIGISNTPREADGFNEVRSRKEFVKSAEDADFLVNVLPGGPANAHAISSQILNALPARAFFINVGRGETVDEDALLAVLKQGRIAGAGLDVFAGSPLKSDSPFWDLDNVIVSPQIAGYFSEYEDYVYPIVVDNMRAYLDGNPDAMRNIVSV